ncbi:hypothetical protein HOE04_05170 [archaeon]|jgi:predicted dehydrogenase|nr:hypothetical protein [archaeon]
MEEKGDSRKINICQFGYTSEWALAKFFPAVLRNGFSEYFNLKRICGREPTKERVIERLTHGIIRRCNDLLKGKNWRAKNTRTERHSCADLIDLLVDDKVEYSDASKKLDNIPDDYGAAILFVNNPVHLKYIETLVNKGKHILCEKPIVTVTNKHHEADRTQLDRLEKLVEENPELVLMDAEHYSAKKATITFYEKLGEMVADYGRIAGIEAYTYEKDDPKKERTKTLLSRKNQTGLLLDMGVHLFGVISNIGGEVTEINNATYGSHKGYDVETYVDTSFNVQGNLFHENAKANFTFAKFIDKLKKPIEEDNKQFNIIFENRNDKKNILETKVTIDFNKGTVTDSNNKTWYSDSDPATNEYENILKQFYNSIIRKQEPRTSFRRSIQNLDAIHRVYESFPMHKNLLSIYKK